MRRLPRVDHTALDAKDVRPRTFQSFRGGIVASKWQKEGYLELGRTWIANTLLKPPLAHGTDEVVGPALTAQRDLESRAVFCPVTPVQGLSLPTTYVHGLDASCWVGVRTGHRWGMDLASAEAEAGCVVRMGAGEGDHGGLVG